MPTSAQRGSRRPSGVGSRKHAASTMPENVVPFPAAQCRPRRRWLRWLLAAVSLVALAAGAAVLYFSPVLAVDRITVEGTRLVDREEVESRLEPLLGVPLPQVGRGRVEELAGGLPGIDSLDVVAAPPTGLQVIVQERRPVAAGLSGRTARVLMDDGAVLSGVPASALADVLQVDAGDGLLRADARSRAAAARVLAELPASLREDVTDVQARAPDDVVLTLDGGVQVRWGGPEDPAVKAAVVEALRGGAEEDAPSPRRIDVSVPDRPVTR